MIDLFLVIPRHFTLTRHKRVDFDTSMEKEPLMRNGDAGAGDIVIVGAGIAGLATALGLHRLGIRSIVLESSGQLRMTGSAFGTWTNAWVALDALGIGDTLRAQHVRHIGLVTNSTVLGIQTSDVPSYGEHRCLKRKVILETLANELPTGTIRFKSKVISMEDAGCFKLLRLADGSFITAKAVIGCDGVNSQVATWLGFEKPAFAGRTAVRGYVDFEGGHGFDPKVFLFSGKGVRYGLAPCDDTCLYWFYSFTPSNHEEGIEEGPRKAKQFVLNNMGNVSDKVRNVIVKTNLDDVYVSPLRYRKPWEILLGNITKDNVCIAGDAFHPMTPELAQGACAALEDAVVLARCLGEALTRGSELKPSKEEEYEQITAGLQKYAQERKWRAADLVTTAYMLGLIQQSNFQLIRLMRDKVLSRHLAKMVVKKSTFKCGDLKTA
ncbi:Monooxygenase 2-like protein [Drosera capensis]